jgi:hypothetical protein
MAAFTLRSSHEIAHAMAAPRTRNGLMQINAHQSLLNDRKFRW